MGPEEGETSRTLRWKLIGSPTDLGRSLSLESPERLSEGLADTGAQMVVLGPHQLAQLGVKEEELTPVKMKIITADDYAARGGGLVLIKITAKDET